MGGLEVSHPAARISADSWLSCSSICSNDSLTHDVVLEARVTLAPAHAQDQEAEEGRDDRAMRAAQASPSRSAGAPPTPDGAQRGQNTLIVLTELRPIVGSNIDKFGAEIVRIGTGGDGLFYCFVLPAESRNAP
jgi:hypothetical protein